MKNVSLLACVFFVLACLPASAIIIGVENFVYPEGAIANQSGGTFWNWRNRTPAARSTGPSDWDNVENAPSVASGRLVMGGSGQNAVTREYNGPGEGSGADIDRDDGLGAINNFNGAITFQEKKLYYRVTVRTGATLPGYFGLSSHDFSTEKLFFGKRGGSSTFGLESVGGLGTNGTRIIDPNTTYTLVVRIDYVAGTIALFVNPSLIATEPVAADVSQTFDTSFWSTAVRLSAGGGGDPVQWDDLVVATSWADFSIDPGIVVNTLADEDDGILGGGTGVSLREAVKHAPGDTRINFDPGLSGQTIVLTHHDGDMSIDRNITIDATALPRGLTVNGNNATRHFFVESGKSLTLRGLTLTGGNGSGAGSNDNFGGAIYNNGTVELTQCTLYGNAAGDDGGAIYNIFGCSLTLTQCTLSSNAAGTQGGAMYDEGGYVTLRHCTLSGNTAGSNGGAIMANFRPTLIFTIVAGNSAPNGPDIHTQYDGGFIGYGVNLIGDVTGLFIGGTGSVLTGDAKLSPLGYFGGPVQTMHPLIGSPAIDAAGSTNPGGTDARGFPRFVDGDTASAGAQLDIGAVEAGPLLRVTTTADVTLSSSLRSRIEQAAAVVGTRIGFATMEDAAVPFFLNLGEFAIPATANGLFIDASDRPVPVTLSGNYAYPSRVFNIPPTATVAMHSVRIVNGSADEAGGILNLGTCTVLASSVSGNKATRFSGGGMVNRGNCMIAFSTFSGNSAEQSTGGGILNSGAGVCYVVSSTFSTNSSKFEGGAIRVQGKLCSVVSSTICGNTSTTNDGGIGINGTTIIRSSIVAGNSAPGRPDIEISSATITNSITSGDPLLAPLADNGGRTQTMRLLPGSPGIAASTGSTRLSDQRGFPIVGAPDIGAYEGQIGAISDISMVENETPPTRTFPVGQIGALTGSSSNLDLVPFGGIDISGSGASRSVTVRPAAGQFGTCIITLTEDLHGEQQRFQFEIGPDNTFLVTNNNPNGPGSLQVAFTTAAGTPGTNTIRFAPGVTEINLGGELFLQSTAPEIIDAGTQGLILNAASGNRHFQVPAGRRLTLRGITLQNGNANGDGGSIYSEGTLILERCNLMFNHSNFSGGAVESLGPIFRAVDCSFTDNSATFVGGGLRYRNGTAELTGCTIARNTAVTGAGVNSVLASLPTIGTFTQCTIANNNATGTDSTGGIEVDNGKLTLIHCTVSQNTGIDQAGGLKVTGSNVTITHSIIAGNTSTGGGSADIFMNGGILTPSGANLIGSNQSVEAIFPAGPLVGTTAAPLDPKLASLDYYGGTLFLGSAISTMPPNVNSPAIDQASRLSPAFTTDQRGQPRPMGLRPDIGAVESSVIIVTTPVDELDPERFIGNGISLREAVRDIPAGGTIGFDRAVFNSLTTNTISLTKGPLNPQRNCTLSGAINPGGINVLQTPTITAQPLPLSLASGATANFTVSVTNLSGGLAYEWRKNGTSNGITTPALTLVNVQEADEAVYDVNIIEAVAPGTLTQNGVILDVFATTSQPAALIVDGSDVTIQRHPSSAMRALGSSHTLSVVAIGPAAPALTYQWFKAGRAIAGATKSSYVIPKVALSHAGAYTCVVKSGTTSPGVTSSTAEIGVVDTSLRTLSLKEGSKFTATVVAAGNGLSYDWNRNGLGDTTKTLTINSVSMDDADLVQCIVSLTSAFGMKGGRVQLFVSNAAPALVTPLAPPTAYIGQNYFYQLPVVNTAGAPALSFSLTGALPSGLTFDKTTGILSGRPTVTKSAGYPLSFKASNASGSSPAATATLQVNVVPSTAVGTFAGPIPRSPLNDNLGGRFDLTTTATGLCSGSVTLGARAKLSFTNQLLLSSGVSDAILRVNIPGLTMADKTPLTAYLEVFATDQTVRLTLVHPNSTTLLATAWRNSWSRTRLATAYAATYTARLDPANSGNPPRGYGFATLIVKPDGTLTLTGKLPDGSGLTQAGFVGPEGQLTVFNLLNVKRGSLVGPLQIIPETPVANNALGGTLDWLKLGPLPRSADTVYQAGFGPLNVAVEGSPYIAPAKGQRVMGLGTTPNPNAKLDFTLGGLVSDFTQLLHITNPSATGLTNKGTLTLPLTNTTKLTTLDAAKGQFKGSFVINGATVALNRPAPFEGQIVKIGATTQGYGFFLLPSVPTGTQRVTTSPKQSGRVVLAVP